MDKNEFNDYLKNELNKLNISIEDNRAEYLYNYMEELLEWNE